MQVKLVQNPKVVWHWLPEEPDKDCRVTILRKWDHGYDLAEDINYTVLYGLNTSRDKDGNYSHAYAMTWESQHAVAWTYATDMYKVEVIE